MKIKNRATLISATVILICTISAGALYWSLGDSKLTEIWGSVSNQTLWDAALCRAHLYLQKAIGEIPELSWSELWGLTLYERGFHCAEGRSLEASLEYSATASEGDRSAGARIFHKQCAGCHGNDGAGGPHAPSLRRSGFKHGDSDLAIYKALRDGIPGTAMPSAGLPLRELLQVIANVKTLQPGSSENHTGETSRWAIQVSSERLLAASAHQDEWLTYSGSYNGWRHKSLAEITPAKVAQLRIRWIKQFDSNDSTIEATPLVIDGLVFIAVSVSKVSALDAKTGDLIWEYQRQIPTGLPLCCGRVNRGLAAYGNTIFFGSADGYLVAINANGGKLIWQTPVAKPSDGYSITGAPLVVNHSVVVGVAGGEFGIRGFLAAYDVSTGQEQWKFETIPAPGEVGSETWKNEAWRTGGGATWVTGSYDPSTDLLYWGVGNPSPNLAGDVRPGDNLFTNSVIALHASTGKLAWYFQFTPHDEHDWDSAQTPVLADLPVNGEVRKVICWPNRNGFYYVLDRVTGEFLVGVPFVELNWAKGLTSKGRPILSDAAEVTTGGRFTRPGIAGGTNWQNPAFDPERRLIFVPATVGSSVFTKQPPNRVERPRTGQFLGSGWTSTEPLIRLVRALDACTGQQKWEYNPSTPGRDFRGLLSTEGGLVFGASGGILFAMDADTGREVWRASLGGSTWSAPISFTVDGRQVIAVAAGRALFVFGL
jgi:alcohol dehydrogenase (cytochrome c)